MKAYRVQVKSKFPSWNEVPGILVVKAETAEEAISKARKMMRRDCVTEPGNPIIYKIVNDTQGD
jgi:hypothetical protein